MSSAQPKRQMTIYPQYLRKIASGKKTIEVRVAYPNNRTLAPGNLLGFVSGEERCLTRIIDIAEYSSFEDLLDAEDPAAIGFEKELARVDMLKNLRDIYPPEKERLGVLAIKVKVVL